MLSKTASTALPSTSPVAGSIPDARSAANVPALGLSPRICRGARLEVVALAHQETHARFSFIARNLDEFSGSPPGKEDDGTRREHTDFHSLVTFGKTAEFAAEHLRKGRLLYAEGRSQTRSWETSDGQRRYSTEVVVDTIQLLSPRPEQPS